MTPHLVVMSKAPRIGGVKSRLATSIGPVAAWAFHRTCLADTARKLKDPRWNCWLAVTPDRTIHEPRLWPPGWQLIAQGPGDLGARMFRPWAALPPGPVVIVGSDIPAVQTEHVAAAFAALGENDLVFGPATDGGFWLVGARRRPHLIDPFRDVRWSTEHALADTLAYVADGTKIGFVETLSDVDEAADLA